MNFGNLVSKFFFFILLNFFFLFQIFFSLNFFFSAVIDEEFIICCAIFFVFILFINQIISGLQDMLKTRIEIYLNVFLMIFRLLRKGLKRLQKHNNKLLGSRNNLLLFFFQIFFKNLVSFSLFQNSLNLYLIHLRLKTTIDFIIADFDLRMFLKKEFLKNAYVKELKYFQLIKNFN